MLELMSDARRAEIKARMQAATRGEWDSVSKTYVYGDDKIIAVVGLAEDRDFIVHARTDLPDLYAENEALRAVVSAMESDKVNYEMNLEHLTADLERVSRELEEAKLDIGQECGTCKFVDQPTFFPPCDKCGGYHEQYLGTTGWEWRGVSAPTDHAQGAEGGGEG